ncbi:hypothetical protein [Pyrobaculum sp.]|uniref:hypothetical protein n=1 Tax=Pyrobaculum sp. TaxID=2004705 RepID=UPI003163BD77
MLSQVFIFKDCPPPQAVAKLRQWGIEVVALAECPGVQRVFKYRLREVIRGKIAVVVGDKELAQRLGVAYASYQEVEDFLRYLDREVSPAYMPYLQ